MASSYNRKSDSSASRAQRRASAAGKRSSASASTSRKSVRNDSDRGQGSVSAKSNSSRRSRGSMDDASIAAAAAAAMSGGSVSASSAAPGATRADVVDFSSNASAAGRTSSSSAATGFSANRRQRSATRSPRVSSVRSAALEPAGSVRRERGLASSARSEDRSSRSTRSSLRSSAEDAGSAESPRRSSRRSEALGESPSDSSSRRRASRADKDATASSKKRKSIRDKAGKSKGKKKDAAPAGTDDLSTSESTRRRRNRDVDEVAAEGGRRVGDIRASRAAERAARARKRYLSYVLKLAVVVATVLVVVFGSIFVYRSNLLAITSVTVSGAEHLTDQEVTQLAAVPDDSTLLRLDTASICSRLEEHPWVQSAQISRQFPNSIKIRITERTPSAVVKISKKSIWVISTDGAWLSAATKDDWKNYRRIVDADTTMSAPVAGSECTNEGVLNALKIYDGVSSKLAEQISSISAESAVKTSLTLKGGVTVAFGEADNLELKEADIFALLDKYSGTVSYINVRVPDRPTYRTAKQ